MSLKIDRLQLEIIINNDQSRKQLNALETEAKQLRKALKKLPEASEEYVQKSKRLKSVQLQMDNLTNKIGLTGLSLKQLGIRQRELNGLMSNMNPNLPAYKKLNAQLQKVNTRMGELRAGARDTGSSMKKLAGNFNHYIGMIGAATAAMAGLFFGIKNLIEGNAKLSDSIADVRKTTGLTEEEVIALSRSLKKIDTRSPRSELMNLSRIAGKLGVVGAENILGFVKAADQINVALSEDLGGNAEEAIRQLGKLVDIYKVQDEFGLEDGLLKVGSAINALGAASTANEAFIVNFAQKIGGAGKAAGYEIPDILGLAATMDILGARSELSTTAIQKMLVSIGKDTPKFAKIAGMSLKDFSKILEDDVNEAFIKVLEGAKSNKKGLAGMTSTLETLGISSARAASVASLLTQNTELLRKQQILSNAEFEKGTSLTEEFAIKNTNLAARLAKLGKKFRSVFYSTGIMDIIKKLIDGMFWLVDNIVIIAKVLGIATIALVSYVTAKKLAVLWTNKSAQATILETLATNISAYAQKAYRLVLILTSAAQALLTGNLKKAAIAMRLFSIATKLSPIGLLVGAITAAAAAYMFFNKSMKDASAEQRLQQKLHEKTSNLLAKELAGFDHRFNQLEKGNISEEKRKVLMGEINKRYGKYLPNLLTEKTSMQELLTIRNAANKSIRETIELKVKENLATDILTEKIQKEIELDKQRAIFVENYDSGIFNKIKSSKAWNKISKLTDEIKDLEEEYALIEKLIQQSSSNFNIDTGTDDDEFDDDDDNTTGTETSTQTKFDPTKLGGGTLDQIIKFGQERQKALQSQRKEDISSLQSAFDQETKIRKTELNKQLLALGNNEKEKARLKKLFQIQELLRQRQHLSNLVKELEDQMQTGGIDGLNIEDAMLSDEEKEKLDKKITDLKLLLSELNIEISDLSQPNQAEPTDLFGMTEKDWENFMEKFSKAAQLAGELNNIWAGINKLQENRDRDAYIRYESLLNKRKTLLEKKLEDGLISEEYYNRAIETFEEHAHKTRIKLANEQAKRERSQALYSAFLNTATAVIGMLAKPGGTYGFILSALAAITGGIQIGIIATQPMPQYSKGGYTDVIGAKDKKKYKAKLAGKQRGLITEPSILTAEKGPEYVIPAHLLKNQDVINYITEIERMRVTGQFYEGGFTSPLQMNYPKIIQAINFSKTSTQSSKTKETEIIQTTIEKTFTDPSLVEALNRFSGIMEQIDRNGLEVPWNKIKEKNDQFEQIQQEVNN